MSSPETDPRVVVHRMGSAPNGASASTPAPAPKARRARAKPTIRIVNGEIERVVDEAEAALLGSGRGLYQHGGRIVSGGEVKVTTSNDGKGVSQRIIERGDYSLVEDLTAAAIFQRFDKREEEWVTCNAPMAIAKTLRERGTRLRLPVLTGIVNAPTIRPDGSILDRPGYDSATGILFDPRGASFPKIPSHPSQSEGRVALRTLESLFATMPFRAAVDRSVAISAVLTAMSRVAYPSAPMHAMTAPVAGSGKSMVVDTATMIATGRKAAVLALGKNPEETEKRLGGALMNGDPVLALDNCEAPVGGDLLCQILTQSSVRIRPLGNSTILDLPTTNVFVTATGNNLVVLGDMTRRTLISTIDPATERPELRVFNTPNPVMTAQNRRGDYVKAGLVVLRSYIVAGRPAQQPPLGSFEGWSRTVRDALLWLGAPDPAASMEEGRRTDPTISQLGTVMSQWNRVIGAKSVTANEVVKEAIKKPTWSSDAEAFQNPEFRDALLAVAGPRGQIDSRSLGNWLRKNQNRVIDGFFLAKGVHREGIQTWALVPEGTSIQDDHQA